VHHEEVADDFTDKLASLNKPHRERELDVLVDGGECGELETPIIGLHAGDAHHHLEFSRSS
jgi:hypothetical protein